MYGFIVLALGGSHQVALAASLVAAIALSALFFRQARAFLLAVLALIMALGLLMGGVTPYCAIAQPL